MARHPERPIAGVLLGLCVVMTTWSLASLVLPGSELIPDRPTVLDFLAFTTIFLLFPMVGAVVVWKRPGNMIGWLFLFVGLQLSLAVFSTEYAGREAFTGVSMPGTLLVAWLGNLGWFLAAGAALPLAIATFPTGEHVGPGWRRAFRVVLAAVGLVVLTAFVKPGPLEGYNGYFTNPTGIEGPIGDVATEIYLAGMVVVLGSVLLGVAALITRFRRSHGAERQQLKWIFLPTALLLGGVAGAIVAQNELAWTISLFGLAGIPLAAGAAILRYRLYDIDVVIRRTLVYGLVVVVLAGVYGALVVALQSTLTGITGSQGVPVALSTLAIAALFGPVRGRVRAAVDRRFFRSRYDAERTLATFAGQLREVVELEQVGKTLVEVAATTVRPASAAVWIRRRVAQ